MEHRDIVVIGASTGGVKALLRLAEDLPPDLPAAVFVVLHTSPKAPGLLPGLLSRAGPLAAAFARDGERNYRHRPSVDALFRSAARHYGPRVIAVVLTGALDDGTAGVIAVKEAGGTAMVQDPSEAYHPSMPANALLRDHPDYVEPLSKMGGRLAQLTARPAEARHEAKKAERGRRKALAG